MLDISRKFHTLRIATAEASVRMLPTTVERIRNNDLPKGSALEVAKVAAIQAAKQTSTIIPYCHPLGIEFAGIEYSFQADLITATITMKAIHRTGVEMEALTAASVAALTIYDMAKMIDETMSIETIRLVKKRGGKSDFREVFKTPLTAAVIVMSDSIFAGKKTDSSGKLIVERLTSEGFQVLHYEIVPDEVEQIAELISSYCDAKKVDLVMTTGGTGFSPRDTTPEAMLRIIEREIPGIPEAMRGFGQERTPYSMLSRSKAGIRKQTLIINLPGSRNGVAESLDALFPGLLHAFPMLWGESTWHKKDKL